MDDDSSVEYPDWYPQYKAAMLELDRSVLRERILAAQRAISQRMQVLSQDHFGTPEERNAIADALHGLAMLERELHNKNKEQAAGD